MWRVVVLSVGFTIAAGCRGSQSPAKPKATVVAFARAVQSAQRNPENRRRVYELLSERGKEQLVLRAQLSSQVSGWLQQPWEMLAPGRIKLRVAVESSGLTARVDGDRAWVTVRGVGGVAEVPLVRENGVWKVDVNIPTMEQLRPGDDSADGGISVLPPTR